MMDITWQQNTIRHVVDCAAHGERNTVVACSVCVGYARTAILRYEQLMVAVANHADETDYCIICDNHPSHGHAKNCLLGKET